MKQKTFVKIAGIIFGLVAFVHLVKVLFAWDANIGGWEVPLWISYIAVVIAGFLAYSAYKLLKK